MTKQWWQTLATLALGINAFVLITIAYFGLSYGSNLKKLGEVGDTCFGMVADYDSIRAAQMIGRLDLVSFLLTAGGILLALFAFMGFWMIRREALDEAAKVAADTAREVAQNIYKNEPRTDGGDKEGETPHIGPRPAPPAFDPKDVSVAGAVREKDDAKPKRSPRSNKRPSKDPAGSGG